MTTFLGHLRYAARRLLRTPGFTLSVVTTLTICTGASTALFSAIDGLLLRPLPLHEPEALVRFEARLAERRQTAFSYPQFAALKGSVPLLTGVAAVSGYEFSLREAGPSEGVPGEFVSGEYFDLLGVTPAIGRFFSPEEDVAGGPAVVVLSYGIWQQRFGGDRGIVGRTILLRDEPFTVIGVTPEGFATIRVGGLLPQLWVPFGSYTRFGQEAVLRGAAFMLTLVGRIGGGSTADEVSAQVISILRANDLANVFNQPIVDVETRPFDPINENIREPFGNYLVLLSVATGLLMLVGAVNVAGMLLVRAASRRRELAIRRAMGASGGRVIRDVLTEGLMVFLLGAIGGVVCASWILDSISSFPWPVPVGADLPLDLRVLGFSLMLALVLGVLANLLPALLPLRTGTMAALKSAGDSMGRGRLRSAFVAVQLGVALLLLVSAGLFARALQRAWAVNPGFTLEGLAHTEFNFRTHGYTFDRDVFLAKIVDGVRSVPGVQDAAFSTLRPFSALATQRGFTPQGVDLPSEFPYLFLPFDGVSPNYFSTMGIPLLIGRTFSEDDWRIGLSAVINQAMADRLWPGENPVGKTLQQGQNPIQVIGLVGNVKAGSLGAVPEPMIYEPLSAEGLAVGGRVQLYLRMESTDRATLTRVRDAIRSLDPLLPSFELAPVESVVAASLLPQRIGVYLVGGFGVFGVLLTALGLYGLIAHSVMRQTREIAVRVALGASRERVVHGFFLQGLWISLAGIGLGLTGALAASGLLAHHLYGLSPIDLPTFAWVGVTVIAIAGLASYLPARRATSVDPMTVLRHE